MRLSVLSECVASVLCHATESASWFFTIGYTLYSWSELRARPAPEWQVDHIFPVGSFVVVYGASGEGKSFLTLDLALSVAEGHQWLGRQVQQGAVVYVAAEGGSGIRKRVAAWMEHHGVDDVPNAFFLLEDIQVTNREELENVLALIRERGIEPVLIVVDTLARCFQGNENSTEDMGEFVKGVAWLQQTTGGTVIVVHHTGKQNTVERGSSSLRAAADVMIQVSMNDDEVITVKNDKMKDHEEFDSIRLQLQAVAVPGSDDASCVLVPRRQATQETKKALPPHLRKTLVVLKRFADGTGARKELLQAVGVPDRTLDAHLKELEKLEYVERVERGRYKLTQQGSVACQSAHQRMMGTAATAKNPQVVIDGKSPIPSAASATTP